jgi:hypothetical protein
VNGFPQPATVSPVIAKMSGLKDLLSVFVSGKQGGTADQSFVPETKDIYF